MLIIDAHPHIYAEDERKYPPIDKPLRPPKGTGTVQHLRREMQTNDVARAIVIQTSTFYRWDNRFIRDTVKANPDWCTGVVTLNPDDPHSPDLLYALVRRYGVRGLRSIPAANEQIDHPGVRALWDMALEVGIVVNVLIAPSLADQLARLLKDFPRLRVVLDHCMMFNESTPMQPTVAKVVELARFSNLHAKLTFVPTMSKEAYPCRDMHEPCKHVIKAFGPDRCVWGSDFPCELWAPRVTYGQHMRIFTHELGLNEKEQAAILGATSQRLWFA